MQDNGRDTSRRDADDVSDGRWLTYAELAQLRGIDRASAFKLALRRKWRRQKNNKGQVAVLVPFDFSGIGDGSQDNGYDASYRASFDAALTTIREAQAGEVAALRGQVDAARAEADMSRDMAHRTLEQLAEATTRADRLREERDQARAEALEARQAMTKADQDRAAAVAIADEAVRAAEDLRQARTAKAGQGRWARIRAAWRGA